MVGGGEDSASIQVDTDPQIGSARQLVEIGQRGHLLIIIAR